MAVLAQRQAPATYRHCFQCNEPTYQRSRPHAPGHFILTHCCEQRLCTPCHLGASGPNETRRLCIICASSTTLLRTWQITGIRSLLALELRGEPALWARVRLQVCPHRGNACPCRGPIPAPVVATANEWAALRRHNLRLSLRRIRSATLLATFMATLRMRSAPRQSAPSAPRPPPSATTVRHQSTPTVRPLVPIPTALAQAPQPVQPTPVLFPSVEESRQPSTALPWYVYLPANTPFNLTGAALPAGPVLICPFPASAGQYEHSVLARLHARLCPHTTPVAGPAEPRP